MTWKSLSSHREHGGDIDVARQRFGRADMIDLSTGISPQLLSGTNADGETPAGFTDAVILPPVLTRRDVITGCPMVWHCVPAGTQALLQLVPLLASDGTVWIEQPTYNEHAPAWLANGHDVSVAPTLPTDARHAVVVLPNNPTGRADYVAVEALAAEIGRRQGLLLVDGAFAGGDTDADDVRLLEKLAQPHVLHLRSFGKFFGMAGLRLGFAIGPEQIFQSYGKNRSMGRRYCRPRYRQAGNG